MERIGFRVAQQSVVRFLFPCRSLLVAKRRDSDFWTGNAYSHAMRLRSILALCVAVFLPVVPALSQAKSPQGYELVWADEFSKDGWPDPRNWTYERGFTRNHEAQWYQADNAIVKG